MKNLKDPKILTVAALFTGLGIALGLFKIPLTPLIEIRLGSLPVCLAGAYFGPGVGAVVGALVDIGGFVVKPTGPYFPGFTISGIISGIIFGSMMYGKKPTLLRLFITQVVYTVIVGILLNSLWLSMLYMEGGYIAVILARLPKEIVMMFVNTAILFAVIKSLEGVRIRELAHNE